ncbi:unnamed protein product [Kuraishia capsulata CBS 1993]|uniref:Uncharacterized protein n=1 Tax=Kuraishia capsulata CBS 1993 TaxID=1382522 RepID=W6MM59_9ASCO|nr:uncharacterized protein KUCA_T00003256001 [Kuraishia capsulata CBS 1993]CDK27278.1 unnamed protein product [Kuraishia capsulata CBS 1993]
MAYYQQQGINQNPSNLQFYSQQGQTPFAVSGSMNTGSAPGYQYGSDISGSMGDNVLSPGILAAFSTSGYAGEPSLLEELGINFSHIKSKTLAVLNPMSRVSPEIATDSDLAGPILFCLLFGTLLLIGGKTHFGYIYGVALFGTISIHNLFKLMSNQEVSLDIVGTASVLGYCLLPLVILSFFAVFFHLDNTLGYLTSILVVLWCTVSSSGFFVTVLMLQNARPLVAYPLAMFYSVFALMAIFVEKS